MVRLLRNLRCYLRHHGRIDCRARDSIDSPELAEEWKRHVKKELLSAKTKAKALAVSYHTNRETATTILAEAY